MKLPQETKSEKLNKKLKTKKRANIRTFYDEWLKLYFETNKKKTMNIKLFKK